MDGNSESIPLGPERSWKYNSRCAVRRVRFSPKKNRALVLYAFFA